MEFANEGSLFSLLHSKEGGTYKNYHLITNTSILHADLLLERRWQFAIDAAKAVEYVHSQRILHRDLKSPNFLLSNGKIKLADFGMSATVITATRTTRSFY